MLFFEQLLADYLAQLARVDDLLSVNGDVEHTRFTRDIFDVPNVAIVLRDFVDFAAAQPTEVPLDDPAAVANKWKDYRRDTEASGYRDKIQKLAENDKVFVRRRNALLDHLLARFGEQLSEYATVLRSLRGDGAGVQLIEDKQAFLADYPALSTGRSRGVDMGGYYASIDQASGLQRRVSALLGLPRHGRRFLSHEVVQHFQWYLDEDQKWHVRVRDGDGETLFEAVDTYDSNSAAGGAARQIRTLCGKEDRYAIVPSDDQSYFTLALRDDERTVAVNRTEYASEREAREALSGIVAGLRWPAAENPVESVFEWWLHSNGKWRVRLLAARYKFAHRPRYDDEAGVISAIAAIIAVAHNRSHYHIEKTPAGRFTIHIRDYESHDEGHTPINLAYSTKKFDSRAEAESVADEVADFFEQTFHPEGFHVIEHILLRPHGKKSPLLDLPLTMECDHDRAQLDPYSFRATVVLPAAPQRFRNMSFRHHVEQTLRMEAPAHVALRICWVDRENLHSFEKAYRGWLQARVDKKPGSPELDDALAALGTALRDLRSIYPEAVLYDPGRPITGRPVVLGHSILGTFDENPDEDGEL